MNNPFTGACLCGAVKYFESRADSGHTVSRNVGSS
mgnify:CR=1 FL=1